MNPSLNKHLVSKQRRRNSTWLLLIVILLLIFTLKSCEPAYAIQTKQLIKEELHPLFYRKNRKADMDEVVLDESPRILGLDLTKEKRSVK